MPKMKGSLCQLWLTCASEAEADKIAHKLLEKKLIACAKQIPISSDYWWQGKIEHAKEVLLLMESLEDFFQKVESEIAKLHSYDTFVLEAVRVSEISTKARGWLEDELINGK